MEFLMTYGWAVLIMLIVIAILFMLGLFNPTTGVPNSCVLPQGFSCYGYAVRDGGVLSLDIGQATGGDVIINAMGCTAGDDPTLLTLNQRIKSGHHVNLTGLPTCYKEDGSVPETDEYFRGTLYIQYTDVRTRIVHNVKGDLAYRVEQTAEGGSGHTPTPTPGGSATPTPTGTATPTPTATATPTPTPSPIPISYAYGITSDGTYAYWVDYSTGMVLKADVANMCSGSPCVITSCDPPYCSMLASVSGTSAIDITTDGSNVYWVDMGGYLRKTGINTPCTDAGCTVIATGLLDGVGGINPFLVTDGTYVYWAEANSPNRVRRALTSGSCSGASCETIYTSSSNGLFGLDLSGSTLYVVRWGYSSVPPGGAIIALDTGTLGATILADNLEQPKIVARGSTDVFWTTGGGAVKHGSASGYCNPCPTTVSSVFSPWMVLADGSSVYWSDGSNGLGAVSQEGSCSDGGCTYIASAYSLDMAFVGSQYIVFTNGDGSKVGRVVVGG